MLFSLKNYNSRTGLSGKIHREPQVGLIYEVKGPMGKGLMISPSGIHIAFAAGTGILCFIDLVAHLIQLNLELIDYSGSVDMDDGLLNRSSKELNTRVLLDTFELHLYVSFASVEESIAL